MIYNPQTGAMSAPPGARRPGNLGYEAGGVIVPVRRTQR